MSNSFANLRAAVLASNTLSTSVFAKEITYRRHGAQTTFTLNGVVRYDARLKTDDASGLEVFIEQAKIKFARADLVYEGDTFIPSMGDAVLIDGDDDRSYLFAYVAERRDLWLRGVFERLAIRTQGISRR